MPEEKTITEEEYQKLLKDFANKLFATIGAEGRKGITLRIALNKFKEDWSKEVRDYVKELKFKNEIDLIKHGCNNYVQLVKEDQYMLYPVEDETTRHQMGLINDTKVKKKGARGNSRISRPGVAASRIRPTHAFSNKGSNINKPRGAFVHRAASRGHHFTHTTYSRPLNEFGDLIKGTSNHRHKKTYFNSSLRVDDLASINPKFQDHNAREANYRSTLQDYEPSTNSHTSSKYRDYEDNYAETSHDYPDSNGRDYPTSSFDYATEEQAYDYDSNIGFDTDYYEYREPTPHKERPTRVKSPSPIDPKQEALERIARGYDQSIENPVQEALDRIRRGYDTEPSNENILEVRKKIGPIPMPPPGLVKEPPPGFNKEQLPVACREREPIFMPPGFHEKPPETPPGFGPPGFAHIPDDIIRKNNVRYENKADTPTNGSYEELPDHRVLVSKKTERPISRHQPTSENEDWTNQEEFYDASDVADLPHISLKTSIYHSARNSPRSSISEHHSSGYSSSKEKSAFSTLSPVSKPELTDENDDYFADLNVTTSESTLRSNSTQSTLYSNSTTPDVQLVDHTPISSPFQKGRFIVDTLIRWLQDGGGVMMFDDVKQKYSETYGEVLNQFKLNEVLGVQAKNTVAAFQKYEPKVFKALFTISSKVELHYIPNDRKPAKPSMPDGPVNGLRQFSSAVSTKPRTISVLSQPTLSKVELPPPNRYEPILLPRAEKSAPYTPLISNTYREILVEPFKKPPSSSFLTSTISGTYREIPTHKPNKMETNSLSEQSSLSRATDFDQEGKELAEVANEVYKLTKDEGKSASDVFENLQNKSKFIDVAEFVGVLLTFFGEYFVILYDPYPDLRIAFVGKRPIEGCKISERLKSNILQEYESPNKLIKDAQIHNVKFGRFEAPNKPFLLFLSEHEEKRRKMEATLSELDALLTPIFPPIAQGFVGECCLYIGHDGLKRGRIVRSKDDRFLVDCVDNGERLTAHIKDLRILPGSLYEFPAFAILAELSDHEKLFQDLRNLNDYEYYNRKVTEAFRKIELPDLALSAHFKRRSEIDGRCIFKVELAVRGGGNPRPTPFYPYYFE